MRKSMPAADSMMVHAHRYVACGGDTKDPGEQVVPRPGEKRIEMVGDVWFDCAAVDVMPAHVWTPRCLI